MPSANTLTTFDFAIKEHYTPEMVENMVYQNNPLLALIPKYEEMRGPKPEHQLGPQGYQIQRNPR
jgi:hypothetical protein